MKNNQMLSNVILPKKEWGEIDLTDIQDSIVLSIPLDVQSHIVGRKDMS